MTKLARTCPGALTMAILVTVVALLACKKGDTGGDEPNRDDSSTSDKATKDDPADGTKTATKASQGDEVAAQFHVGDPVDVEWKGDWWKAEVRKVRSGPAYYVHYVDWGNEWDEWVEPARIRARTAGSRTK